MTPGHALAAILFAYLIGFIVGGGMTRKW